MGRNKWMISMIVVSLFFSCVEKDKPKPNILWIISDDLSPDLSCYGNPDVNTPNLDQLAVQGVRFTNAYANAPICSASRSSFITGMYPSTINALNHRTLTRQPLPGEVKTIVEQLQRAGYFCTNASGADLNKPGKTDYNFSDEPNYDGTDWSQAGDQPFFAQIQFKYPHRPFTTEARNKVHPDSITQLPCFPDHPLLRADWAAYLTDIQLLDQEVGKILDRLAKDGLSDNTVVVFFGDHGRPHVRDKQFLYEGGVKVPLIVRWPKKLLPAVDAQLVSLVDVAATMLEIAGIDLPVNGHGQSFLDDDKRKYIFGFRDRAGDAVDDIRSISDGEYKLIWNRKKDTPYMQLSSYKKAMYPAYTLYHYLDSLGKMPAPYQSFMDKTRAEYELYDLEADPCEWSNQAGNTQLKDVEDRLKKILSDGLANFEKNAIKESEADTRSAKVGSYEFSKKTMNKVGFDIDAPLDAWMQYWNAYYDLE